VVSPSSLTGSVGVYSVHEDASKYLDNLGVKVTMIKFGENKAAGNPYEPLSDSARADIQGMVDEAGEMFESAVAKGRKTSKVNVHDSFGQGKVFTAKQAVKLGMADTVGTLDDVLGRYGITSSSQTTSMADVSPEIHGEDDPDVEILLASMRRRLEIESA
jgi:ClpP class serine protease